ncbi:MAG: sulfotransferase [Candidatus Thermoplasmatota archaeon]|jgi:hypothetical protein|nr:sulfotransferase [Candidatus Thermoplasmatota archaeon]
MKLDEKINYIVSGLERSGTSMIMQILQAGSIPIAYDTKRQSDENNPKGYYELEGGKIINKLIDKTLPLEKYRGKFIKITAYGLKYLPPGKYKIIYTERNIEEILDSMEKMTGKKDEKREETKKVFTKLNNTIKKMMTNRDDIEVLYINYNNIISNPEQNIREIIKFLGLSDKNITQMIQTVDKKLYRQRRYT